MKRLENLTCFQLLIGLSWRLCPQGPRSGLNIALYLARHGIDAEVQQVQARDIGKAILSHFSSTGMDLLVMGAYGHSRVRELLLGGVTRYILEYMKLPVFMSH